MHFLDDLFAFDLDPPTTLLFHTYLVPDGGGLVLFDGHKRQTQLEFLICVGLMSHIVALCPVSIDEYGFFQKTIVFPENVRKLLFRRQRIS